MPNFTKGSMRPVLQQPDLTTFQGNGSVVLDSRRTRPLWFDGRFLAAKDLEREQDYFLQRQADLGQASGFGVMHGLLVDHGPSTGQPSDAETIVIHAGDGVTPAGELVMVPDDLTIRLSDLAEEENLGLQFGISTLPQQPARTRTGLYIIALRPVEFTANPDRFLSHQHPGLAHHSRWRYRRSHRGFAGTLSQPGQHFGPLAARRPRWRARSS